MAVRKRQNICVPCAPAAYASNCSTCGLLILIVGILFLLKDVGTLTLWGIQPWTVVFLIAGLYCITKTCRS